ncbi:MAG: hypothetical protein GC160_23670 [Acidobacteria bacterium]|nr:hypothetical protein [Acidobacteriota bacterium]
MKKLVAALALGFCVGATAVAADFTYEKIGAPADAPEAIKAMLYPEGVAVKGPNGQVIAEYWGRQTPFEGQPSSGFGIRYDFIPEGAVIALAHFTEEGSDFREQGIPTGWYTLRYALHPEDGNHMGVAPSRDFSVLTPADKDAEPAKNYDFKGLVELTKQVGNPHPTIERVELPEGDQAPNLWENDYELWVLDLPVAGEVVGIVVHGHSEE